MITNMIRYPIRTVTNDPTVSVFTSIFASKKSNFDDTPGQSRAYKSSTRGILIAKSALDKSVPNINEGYIFQFNPANISDTKEAVYEVRSYPGLNFNDYIWINGGERLITFQLFLDNTPQSKTIHFNPKILANEIKQTSKGKSSSSKAAPKFEYTDTAYSNTRVNERGIMPEVELIRSFLYPAPLENEATPLFTEGGIINNTQFRPPQVVVLCVGPMYLEGVVKSAPVEYSLFDKDLTPLRATMDITFAVYEFVDITRKIEPSKLVQESINPTKKV